MSAKRVTLAPVIRAGIQSSPALQRKCGCDRSSRGSCGCRKKRGTTLQRAAVQSTAVSEVPEVVQAVVRSSGRPLEPAARRLFEPRFGRDFSRVRVHTDAQAAASARAVDALAYTVGQHIIFGSGQYHPGTLAGQQLIAHELTHTLQQGDVAGTVQKVAPPGGPLEAQADAVARAVVAGAPATPVSASPAPAVQRKLAKRMMYCEANKHGAPADPFVELTDRDDRAQKMADKVAGQLKVEADSLAADKGRDTTLSLEQSWQNWFGLPPAVPHGFLNRLTGKTAETRDEALSEEMALMSKRYHLVNKLLGQWMAYLCIGGGDKSYAGCKPPDCNAFAWSCNDIGAIFLCSSFWDMTVLNAVQFKEQQASVLVHESGHIIWPNVHDVDVRGSGRNFLVADCYSTFVADTLGFPALVNTCTKVTNPDLLP
jgi:hypothetical protein